MRAHSVTRIVIPLLLGLAFITAAAEAASLNAWQFTAPLPAALAGHAMTATTTHVYALGGVAGTTCTLVDSVNVAPILPDGSLGPWTATTALTFPRGFLGAVVVGKYLYVAGGANGCGLVTATKYATVERAEILPDGTLGPWTAMASLTNPRAHMPVVSDGIHLYAVGGYDGTRTNSVEMTTVLPDGSLASWQAVAGMTVGREAAAASIANGRLYAAGGLGASTLATTEGAVIQADGTLAAWQGMAPLSVPRYQAIGAEVAGSFWVAGGNNEGTLFSTTELAVFDAAGAITGWTAGPQMNAARTTHAGAVSGSRTFVSGGVSVSGGPPLASVEFASAVSAPMPTAVGIYRDGTWYLDKNANGTWEGCGTECVTWGGLAGDVPVVGDWNGTGSTKVGIYRDGTWYLDKNGNDTWEGCGTECVTWGGLAGDVPVVGDWNNLGSTKIGIYRNGTWYLDKNGNGLWDGCPAECITWGGLSGDIPVVGDWNNTGSTKVGIYRASTGAWYLDMNGNGVFEGCFTDACIAWGGVSGDVPVVGDWNNTGSTKIGIYRNGTWYLDRNGNGFWDGCGTECIAWGGLSGDVPVVGDWNNTGSTKVGIYRASTGAWYLDTNGNGVWEECSTDACILWGGAAKDTPVVGKW